MDPAIVIPVTFFISVFGILYIYFSARHKERMSMIEKGADPALFQSRNTGRYTSIRIGMLLVGIAAGILFGNLLAETTRLMEEVAYFSMIFLFGGSSLIAYYLFIDKKTKE